MFEFLKRLLEADDLAPHGICLLWRPELIWTHVISDALIGVAYFSIPIVLAYFASQRRDIAFGWMFWCFAVFITACGATHLFSIWTLWNPDYGTEALIKAVTAAASVATAIALWPLLPLALALPSPEQLRAINKALEEGIRERDEALVALERETSERIKAEDMLRHAQKMEAVGQLTGGIAHDFNNLLSVVIGNLDRLERRLGTDQADLRRAAANALVGAEKAAALTRQLLAFARKQPLLPTSVDVNRMISAMSDLLQRTLGEGFELKHDLAPDLPPVRVDRNQMENALINVAVNGRDAMPKGGVLTLRTRHFTAAEAKTVPELPPVPHVLVEVTDHGEGMTPEVAARVFEPFFTTKPLGHGTGLGLSQVYGFVKQSEGHVSLESEPGRGTTVRLFLPAAQAAPQTEIAVAGQPILRPA